MLALLAFDSRLRVPVIALFATSLAVMLKQVTG